MSVPARVLFGVCGLVVLLNAGCRWYPYSPYYNGYYGQGGYGGPTYAPGGYVDPGATYTPGTYGPTLNAPGSPTPINPGTPTTPTTPNWRQPNGAGGDAPLFDRTVPNPQPDFGTPPAAALPRPQPLSLVSPFPQTVVANIQPTGLRTTDPFIAPARLSSDGNAQPMPTGTSNSEPYAYDGDGFAWLKGIVDFDDETKTWSILYSLVPKAEDPNGGHFVLAPSEELRQLRKGDLVLISGQPHPTLKERGQPMYHVAQVTVLNRSTQ